MDNNHELYHHGVRGQKWGVRRYQNPDGSLTRAGRRQQAKLEKEKAKAEKEADEKKRILESGSAKEVLKYKGKLTQQEMQTAINRINWEQNMQAIAARDREAGRRKVDNVFGTAEKVLGYANTGAKAYNLFANIFNAFNKNDITLPKIDTNLTSGNSDLRRQLKKEAAKEARKSVFKAGDDLSKYSDDELAALAKRTANEKIIRNNWNKSVNEVTN